LKISQFTTTPENPACESGDEWSIFSVKQVAEKAAPVKVWWFTICTLHFIIEQSDTEVVV